MPDKKLIVIGEGPDYKKCKSIAGSNITLMGWQPVEVLTKHMQKAKCFIFAAQEDFGITPIEAQSCGTPVIAFKKGGASETICADPSLPITGLFFDEQTSECLVEAVLSFETGSHLISPKACRENAERFSTERFKKEFKAFVANECQNFLSTQP